MLDVRRLRLLVELSRRGTIASVARALGYTPSGVSQSLAQLERDTGAVLLERDGRGVRLTPAAHGLVAHSKRVLAELDAAEAQLAADRGTVTGTVRISAFPSAAAALAIPSALELSEQYPELSCSIGEHEPEDGVPLLRSGELDLLLSESYTDVASVSGGGLESHQVLAEPLLLLVPAGMTFSEPVGAHMLRDARWISGLAGTQFAGVLAEWCRAGGFEPQVVHRADEAYLIQALVAAGLGIGLLPALALMPSPEVQALELDASGPRRHIDALVRRGAAQRPAVAVVLDALRRRGETYARRSSAQPTALPRSSDPRSCCA